MPVRIVVTFTIVVLVVAVAIVLYEVYRKD